MLNATRHRWKYLTPFGDGRNNLESRALHRQCLLWTSYSLGVLTRSATADFPGVRCDEARPGLPASVDGHIYYVRYGLLDTSFYTGRSVLFIVLEDAVCMSAPVDIAVVHNETEDYVGSFRRLVTTTTSFRTFHFAEHQPPHRRR